jgi:hypothetical protein
MYSDCSAQTHTKQDSLKIKKITEYGYEAIQNERGIYDSLQKHPFSYDIKRFNKDGFLTKSKSYYNPHRYYNTTPIFRKEKIFYPNDQTKITKTIDKSKDKKLEKKIIEKITTRGIIKNEDGSIDSSNYEYQIDYFFNDTLVGIYKNQKLTKDSTIINIVCQIRIDQMLPLYYNQKIKTKEGFLLSEISYSNEKLIEIKEGVFLDTVFKVLAIKLAFENNDTVSKSIQIYSLTNKILSDQQISYFRTQNIDSSGILIKTKNIPEIVETTTYDYNTEYTLIEKKSLMVKSQNLKKTFIKYELDSNNNIIQEIHYNSRGVFERKKIERDENGRIIKVTRNFNSVEDNFYEYFYYNSNGDLIQLDYYFKDCIFNKYVIKYKYFKR